nr:hypothetical protein [uncultured Blautia sp.]
MRKNAKLAPLQTSLRQVAIFPHNADFYWLRKSKMPANAAHINDISALGFGYGQFFPDYCAM